MPNDDSENKKRARDAPEGCDEAPQVQTVRDVLDKYKKILELKRAGRYDEARALLPPRYLQSRQFLGLEGEATGTGVVKVLLHALAKTESQ
eukprot:CAMPEP_0173401484 /NCGR_PEP_ID=MMETSP1356-20130122/51075_1 /TAXON_ID=77927 ORGANISM="Hemiselmis virescens, Strain PCC157" /NCGR_SAMPLE_ID=MMETSP1356 /ASSEMBLY_ACC=CAM_ASM_000847 /LENGTH=90 /DNA_ID=CAMNT_0014361637 /DNA_START=140 /DNA_END=412 /DNA_ORIENTATION=+